ncbi:MAG TPA: radical SAM protein [Lachnospiraceae bacterium]|nr:radical SAM protein [Lachnospiraceae bacterium]
MRNDKRAGRCGMTDDVMAARAALHMWEEPCISGKEGSGAVFFSGCPLGCVFCQNRDIALGRKGKIITVERLARILLELQDKGANNINLVTPTHYVPQIVEAVRIARLGDFPEMRVPGAEEGLDRAENASDTAESLSQAESALNTAESLSQAESALNTAESSSQAESALSAAEDLGTERNVTAQKEMRLRIPVVYNTGSYENPETIRMMKGTVDIFLPDLKYYDPAVSNRYSMAPDYFKTASVAIAEMVLLSGRPVFDSRGMMTRGTIVRHMILPGHTEDSKKILRYLHDTYGNDIYISIMNQYTPMPGIGEQYPELARRLTKREYEKVVDYALSIGIENAYIQEGGTAKESFIPPFGMEGL